MVRRKKRRLFRFEDDARFDQAGLVDDDATSSVEKSGHVRDLPVRPHHHALCDSRTYLHAFSWFNLRITSLAVVHGSLCQLAQAIAESRGKAQGDRCERPESKPSSAGLMVESKPKIPLSEVRQKGTQWSVRAAIPYPLMVMSLKA